MTKVIGAALGIALLTGVAATADSEACRARHMYLSRRGKALETTFEGMVRACRAATVTTIARVSSRNFAQHKTILKRLCRTYDRECF
jgi:hypothetical protein